MGHLQEGLGVVREHPHLRILKIMVEEYWKEEMEPLDTELEMMITDTKNILLQRILLFHCLPYLEELVEEVLLILQDLPAAAEEDMETVPMVASRQFLQLQLDMEQVKEEMVMLLK